MKRSILLWSALLAGEAVLGAVVALSPVPTAVALVAAAAVAVCVCVPEAALYVTASLIVPGPLLGVTVLGVNLHMCHVAALVLAVAWAIARMAKTRPPCVPGGCHYSALALWGWTLLSLLWSTNRLVGIEDSLKLTAGMSVIFLIPALARSMRTLKTVLAIFIIAALVDAALSLVYPYTDFYCITDWPLSGDVILHLKFWQKHEFLGAGGRGTGFMTAHGTAVTASLAIALCVMLALVARGRRMRRGLAACALVLLVATIGTMTKSIIVSVVAGVAYVLLHLRPARAHVLACLAALMALIVASFVVTRSADLSRSVTLVGENLKVNSATLQETSMGARVEMIRIGMKKLWESRGLGTGVGAFLQYTPFKKMDGGHPSVLWDLGLVGMAIWGWMLVRVYRSCALAVRQSRDEATRRMLVVYLGGYINAILSWFFSFAYADIYLWFYLGIGLALTAMVRDNITDTAPLPFAERGETIVEC